ncbi:MAG: hypothetical protein ACYTF6_08890 [Planctomycetota bacterium]
MPDWTKKFDGRLDVRPPLRSEQLSEIPAKRGVVALLAENDSPIILMTAADIRARVRARLQEPAESASRKSADLRQITRSVLWRLAFSHFEADLRYLTLVRTIWPRRYASMLAWKPAWFVHVNAAEKYPHFSATRRVFGQPGRHFGPFGSERLAQKFVGAVQDGFDLCRDCRFLRESPNAERCAYGQMGRCLSPCDGSTSMEDYRKVVAGAADFAAGDRQEHRRRLRSRMARAAGELHFEQAARIKARLERLAEVDSRVFDEVRPAEEFRFIVVQRGASRRQAKVFLMDRGHLAEQAPLEYPLRPEKLERILDEMKRLSQAPLHCGELERWQIGLAARYLFSSERRRGLMIRWRQELDVGEIAARIEDARDMLLLSEARRRASKEGGNGRP